MHRMNICHRDLKPQNILFDRCLVARVLGLGTPLTQHRGKLGACAASWVLVRQAGCLCGKLGACAASWVSGCKGLCLGSRHPKPKPNTLNPACVLQQDARNKLGAQDTPNTLAACVVLLAWCLGACVVLRV
jgi:serine/threonine protein kinase